MSVTQPVPSKEAFLVEFPGYVRNPQAVIQTLGGVDALTKAVSSDDSVLQLRFRPDDPCSHPLYGERQAAAGLLLKIARKVADPSQHSVTAEVLACVHTKFTFSGMADYQYLPVDSSLSRKASSTSAGPYGEETAPLLCVPPLFTQADVPLDYAFKNFRASERPGISPALSSCTTGTTQQQCLMIRGHALQPVAKPSKLPGSCHTQRKKSLRTFKLVVIKVKGFAGMLHSKVPLCYFFAMLKECPTACPTLQWPFSVGHSKCYGSCDMQLRHTTVLAMLFYSSSERACVQDKFT